MRLDVLYIIGRIEAMERVLGTYRWSGAKVLNASRRVSLSSNLIMIA